MQGINTTIKMPEQDPKQVIIPYGDNITQRYIDIQNRTTDTEECAIKLAGFSSLLDLQCVTTPDLKADIHALNHMVYKEDLSLTTFNHALILMSLECITLPTASTPPEYSYKNPAIQSLCFDHPFDLDEKQSLVSASATSCGKPDYFSMKDYSTLEMLKKNGLLQELISIQATTHPYVSVFEHKHSESIVLVLHTGFDGSPHHSYEMSSHTHTRVGFQNYLQYVCERYGHIIDNAVDEEKKKIQELEEIKKRVAIQKLKEAEERSQEVLTPLMEGEEISSAGNKKKNDLKARNSSMKKSATAVDMSISTPDFQSDEKAFPPIEKPILFSGYDLGDMVLLHRSVHDSFFTSDGIQIRIEKHVAIDETFSIMLSLLHNGHKVTSSQIWTTKDTEAHVESSDIVGIPQPLPGLKQALLQAYFKHSLQLSCSHFGPKANGELAFFPHRPSILDSTLPSENSGSRPSSGVTSKLSKKQQEQQQQLLEQQRALEAQQQKERDIAQEKYQRDYDNLLRNNKYQQLYLSTEEGLHVRCQAAINLDADPSIIDGSDAYIVVKQRYFNGSISEEKCRLYHPEGYVIKWMKNGTVVIMCADGTKYQSASRKEVELFHQQEVALSKSPQENIHPAVPELGSSPKEKLSTPDLSQDSRRISSANKVTFADDVQDLAALSLKQNIWIVTTTTGKRYLFRQETGTSPNAGVNSCIVSLSSIHLLKATDPVTKEVSIGYCIIIFVIILNLFRYILLEKTTLFLFSILMVLIYLNLKMVLGLLCLYLMKQHCQILLLNVAAFLKFHSTQQHNNAPSTFQMVQLLNASEMELILYISKDIMNFQ